jgi:hypothetical protein
MNDVMVNPITVFDLVLYYAIPKDSILFLMYYFVVVHCSKISVFVPLGRKTLITASHYKKILNSLNSFCLVLAVLVQNVCLCYVIQQSKFKEPGEDVLLSDWILLRG